MDLDAETFFYSSVIKPLRCAADLKVQWRDLNNVVLVKTFVEKMPVWICTVRPSHLYMCVLLAILGFLFSNWKAALSSFSECSISLPPEALGWFGSTFWVITHLYCETISYQFCSMWLDVSVYSQAFHDWDSLLLIFAFTPLWVTNETVQSGFLTLNWGCRYVVFCCCCYLLLGWKLLMLC